jgi:hypothetical protein
MQEYFKAGSKLDEESEENIGKWKTSVTFQQSSILSPTKPLTAKPLTASLKKQAIEKKKKHQTAAIGASISKYSDYKESIHQISIQQMYKNLKKQQQQPSQIQRKTPRTGSRGRSMSPSSWNPESNYIATQPTISEKIDSEYGFLIAKGIIGEAPR